MCEKDVRCPDCPHLMQCEVSSGLPGSHYPRVTSDSPAGAAEELLLIALWARGLSCVEAYAAAPPDLQKSARSIVFDGANPNDVAAVFDLARLLAAEESASPVPPARTVADPDAYLVDEPTPPATAGVTSPNHTCCPERLVQVPDGRIFYMLSGSDALLFDPIWNQFFCTPNVTLCDAVPVASEVFAELAPLLRAYFVECGR